MALRLRRGTDAERGTITPLSGELIYTTDTKQIYAGDGTTLGGVLVGPVPASTYNVVNDTSPQLGGDLDLNGSDIIGTGNINITGTISATGSINLGDGAEDNVIVGGVISSSLTPGVTNAYDLGTAASRWRQLNVNGINVDGEISALAINSRILADDSTIAYDPATGSFQGITFSGGFEGNLTGDVKGSVFSDGSTVLVDAVAGTIPGRVTGEIITEDNVIANLNQDTIANNNGLEFNMFRGTIDSPTEPNNFDRTNITWNSFDTASQTYKPEAVVIGYHQSGGGGYVGISAADASYTLFNTSIELDGLTGAISIIGTTGVTGSLSVSGGITGDLKGSVVADDSAILVDAVNGALLTANIDVIGSVAGTPSVGAGDLANVNEWLQVTVNGATRYIPLYA